MSFDPNDFHDLADLTGALQRQQMLQRMKHQEELLKRQGSHTPQPQEPPPKNRQCPMCGGRLAGEFKKCQNCGSDIAWAKGFPCEPGKEAELQRELDAEEAKRKVKAARKAAENAECVCTKCGQATKAKNTHDGLCSKCYLTAPRQCPRCKINFVPLKDGWWFDDNDKDIWYCSKCAKTMGKEAIPGSKGCLSVVIMALLSLATAAIALAR